LRQALAAAFKSCRQNLPSAPASLPALLAGCQDGVQGLLGKPGCRDALGEILARLFHTPGRDVEAQALWHESVASAVFAARLARLAQGSVPYAFLSALLHRCGDALALKMLARVELDYRMKLDGAARRDWCTAHAPELAERLVRAWNLSTEVGTGVLGWNQFDELAAAKGEVAAVYFGRLFAIEFLHPQLCAPGALDHAAAEMGLSKDRVAQVRQEDVRSFMRALDPMPLWAATEQTGY
jgi:HDOD domain